MFIYYYYFFFVLQLFKTLFIIFLKFKLLLSLLFLKFLLPNYILRKKNPHISHNLVFPFLKFKLICPAVFDIKSFFLAFSIFLRENSKQYENEIILFPVCYIKFFFVLDFHLEGFLGKN